ncbi:MAG: UDP-N-acetylmuramoyl-tripeptide--D-alanyl-D-alanine ligase [Elusimicrobiota bacterium]
MENIFLSELITAVKGEFLLGDPKSVISSISIDTRTLRKGDFYFAVKGRNYDGHNYLIQAIEKGVKGIVVSKKEIDIGNPFPAPPAIICVQDTQKALGDLAHYYRSKWKIPVIGITGSNGKTTAKEMLASILRQKGHAVSNAGNFNNQIGLPLTIFNLSLFHEYAVLEMGTSYPGEIQRLAEIASPTIGVITNIGSTHLENFITPENVFAEKYKLIESLPQGATAILNADDPFLSKAAATAKTEVITFGIEQKADVTCGNLKLWPGNPTFDLIAGGKKIISIILPVYGRFNVYNALAAAAVAWKLKMSPEMIRNGLETFIIPNMRMNVVNMMSGVTFVIDAYNANPTSMKEAARTFVETFPDRDKILVLGDMLELGPGSEQEHRDLGEFLGSLPLNQILLIGPMMKCAYSVLGQEKSKYFENKDDLVRELKGCITSRNVIFFKASRGMHFEEITDTLIP